MPARLAVTLLPMSNCRVVNGCGVRVIASGWVAPLAIAAVALFLLLPAGASAHIYWTNLNSTVGRSANDGAGAVQNFATGGAEPRGVATDGQFLYWASNGTGSRISRANLDGSGVKPTFIATGGITAGIAVDSQHIYWADFDQGTIGRANLDGTDVVQKFITGVSSPVGVVVDSQHLYWTSQQTMTIGRANLDGSAADQAFISAPNTNLVGIAVDSQHLYWTSGTGRIGRANLDGSAADQAFVDLPGQGQFFGIAVDSQHLYWTSGTGRIGRSNLDGGGVEASFITGAVAPFGVAVDSLPHSSGLAISCASSPLTLPATTSCTMTVTDTGPFTAAPGPIAPKGSVSLTATGGTISASSCTTEVGRGAFSCPLTFRPESSGNASIVAVYSGDALHGPSRGQLSLRIKPQNSFTLAKPKLIRKRGIAILTAIVPGPGRILLKGKTIKKLSKKAKRAGAVKLRVKPKSKLARRLLRSGTAKVLASVTFTPSGGDPLSKERRFKLRLQSQPTHSRTS